jgi:FkbM family methyltransferase
VLPEALGVARSFLIYYATPFRLSSLRRFSRSLLRPGDLAFDLGAHAGNRVYAWTRLGARVVAVEPNPTFFRLLSALWGRHPRVTLLPLAVGASPGIARLAISRRTPTVSTLSTGWTRRMGRTRSFRAVRWDTSSPVEVTTLDQLIERFGVPAFCKIDVEGSEYEVLQGLNRRLPSLSFEFHPAAPEFGLPCLDRLESLAAYEYNWSVGESHRFALEEWVGPSGIRGLLQSLPHEGRSGDVYARLVEARRQPLA